MNTIQNAVGKMTNYRWTICAMLFFATTVNYLDRQVLSLTWKDFIAPEFHWTDAHYGDITAIFSLVYAIANLFAGRFIDWMGTKKGYLWAIAVWSLGACLHALCGWATEHVVGIHNAAEMISATGAIASTIAITSVYFFIAARIVLAVGEAGNFPAAIKVTAEYFPKKDRAFATSIFNAGSTIGALIAPVSIPPLARYFQSVGIGNGWEMAFIVIGGLGFIWMGLWMFMYKKPEGNPRVNAAELAYINLDKQTEQPAQDAAAPKKEERKMSLWECLKYPQAWAVAVGKFMTDRCMVVLPLLDSCLYLGRLWFLLRQRHSPVADFRTLCHHHAVHLWRQAAYHHHQQDRLEPLRRPHACHVHFRPLPAAGPLRPAAG